ncbi:MULTISPECIES: hypothetical protein [Pseudomonas syringae group]|uniref:Uncharacterized protein n=1 Tax=Pseudomonas syringae pv. coriandricola TaxID=264453 RepID=A0A3M3J923_9PSED|nr:MULTISPECIES: hypothetical protein [Pseudomonas syringae group]RMN07300.1 hypothetical protein ALQ65_200081 [Pseudomonas syringae pv. coriandricola]
MILRKNVAVLPVITHPIRAGAMSVEFNCPECGDPIIAKASEWPQIKTGGGFLIAPMVSYAVTCECCRTAYEFRPSAAKENWPDGETMPVSCPNCSVKIDSQIAMVRGFDLPYRPEDCDECNAVFELYADSKTALVSAPPKVTTARGRQLIKQLEHFVFRS